MSSMKEPLSPPEAKALIRHILVEGTVSFTGHAEQEMSKDGLAKVDVENVLRGGAVAEGEWENGTWRYRAFTQRIMAVVAFRSEDRLVVITAWRNAR
jgi:hypothetical protein